MNISYNSGLANLANPKVRRQKFGVSTMFFLLFIGAAFTAVGVASIRASKIDPSWTRIDGTVTSFTTDLGSDGHSTYPAVITYKVSGQPYTVTSTSSSSAQPTIGSSRQIAYNPQQPSAAKVVAGNSQAFLYIFPVVGIALLVLAPVLFVRSIRRSKDITSLQQTGQKVRGIISDIQIMSGGANNRGDSYKIIVSATDLGGTVQQYTSDSLLGIGGLAMADYRNNPIPIDVYINPSNPQDYYVDISEVPNLTPERITDLIRSYTQSHPIAGATTPLTPPLSQPQALPQTMQQPPTEPPSPIQ